MTVKRVVVVGNGRMAQACSEVLLRCPAAVLSLVVAEQRADVAQERLAGFCARANVQILQPSGSVNAEGVVAAIAAVAPDLIFSIDNFQIFGPALLATPRDGCINFHNGPIERYRGVNVPSWAIFNGEKEHGIAWHYMEPNVDAGAIAAARRFALSGTETALSLTLDCIRVGLSAFEEDLPQILAGKRTAAPEAAAALNYRRAQLPADGLLDLRSSAAHIDRLLRATDFRPFPNSFTYARLPCPRGDLLVNEAHALGHNGGHPVGEIVRADSKLIVACADQLLEISAVMVVPDETVSVAEAVDQLGLRVGQRLT
jgi:methionyl-tRNA formyltransferase